MTQSLNLDSLPFDPSRVRTAGLVRSKPGETACGDAIFTLSTDYYWCLALVDGLGHGAAAAEAANTACESMQRCDWSNLSVAMQQLDRELKRTRGAAVTLMRVHRQVGTLTHAAVGNVEVRGATANDICPITTPGVVGTGLRRVVERTYLLARGDVLVAYTDGISERFPSPVLRRGAPRDVANALITTWAQDHDDAGCLVLCC